MGVVKHWLRLPGEPWDCPSLETFKVRLDRALGDLICVKMSLPIAGELDQITFTSSYSVILYLICWSEAPCFHITSFSLAKEMINCAINFSGHPAKALKTATLITCTTDRICSACHAKRSAQGCSTWASSNWTDVKLSMLPLFASLISNKCYLNQCLVPKCLLLASITTTCINVLHLFWHCLSQMYHVVPKMGEKENFFNFLPQTKYRRKKQSNEKETVVKINTIEGS